MRPGRREGVGEAEEEPGAPPEGGVGSGRERLRRGPPPTDLTRRQPGAEGLALVCKVCCVCPASSHRGIYWSLGLVV